MKTLVVDVSGRFVTSLRDYLALKIKGIEFRDEDASADLQTVLKRWKPVVLLLAQDKAGSNDQQILNILQQTVESRSGCKVIVLGDHSLDFVKKVFHSGAYGHIAPHTTLYEVASCFEQVSKGNKFLDSGSLIRLMWMNERDEIIQMLDNQKEGDV